MGEVVNVNPPFTQTYLDIQRLCGEAIVAASKDDVEALHKINHELLTKSVNLAQFSFFGLTIQRINQQAQAKQKPEEADPV